MGTRPFTVDEVIQATGMALKNLRGEMRDAEEKMRKEFKAELQHAIARLRNELEAEAGAAGNERTRPGFAARHRN